MPVADLKSKLAEIEVEQLMGSVSMANVTWLIREVKRLEGVLALRNKAIAAYVGESRRYVELTEDILRKVKGRGP